MSEIQIPFFSFEPMHSPIREDILDTFSACYDRNWYVLGQEVQQFEAEYASWNGTRHAIGVASGLDALILALRAVGAEPGREVIVPSNAYIACWLAVAATGATIVPAEPDPETHNLEARAVEAVLGPNTLAVMPVHLFGQSCVLEPLMSLAKRHSFYVVEDNAQAHGAGSSGMKTGSVGHINATSFYPTKNLGALGDGGAVTTQDDRLAEFVRTYRNYGSEKKYYNRYTGINSRLDEVQAAILRIKLRQLDAWTKQRQALAARYCSALEGIPEIQLPVTAPGCTHVWHLFVIRCARRDALQQYLKERGIQTMIHYPVPPHLQKAFAHLGFFKGQFPIAEQLAASSLSLPFFPGMTIEQIELVSAALRQFYRK